MIFFLVSFPHRCKLIVFDWNLGDCTSPRIPRTLLSILANLNTVAVWRVSICPPIFNSSISLSKPLGTVLSAPITSSTTVIFRFHNFLSSLAGSLFFHFLSFILCGPLGQQCPLYGKFSFS